MAHFSLSHLDRHDHLLKIGAGLLLECKACLACIDKRLGSIKGKPCTPSALILILINGYYEKNHKSILKREYFRE